MSSRVAFLACLALRAAAQEEDGADGAEDNPPRARNNGQCPGAAEWDSHLDRGGFDATRDRLGCLENCEPCLAGAKWDALREQKGLGARRTIASATGAVTVELGNWLSSQVQAAVATILIDEMLGYDVSALPRMDGELVFRRLASGCTTLNHEIWSHLSHKLEDFTQYVVEGHCVHTAYTGVTAIETLWAPAYAASDVCSTLAISTLNAARKRFADPDGTTDITAGVAAQCNAETWPISDCSDGRWLPPKCKAPPFKDGGLSPHCSEMLLGSPTWAKAWFEANVVNLGLNFTTLYLPNLEDEIQRRYANKENFVFYWWKPDPLFQQIDAVKIDLPPWSEACARSYADDPLLSGVACEIQPDTLLRGIHRATAAAEPDLAHLTDTFTWLPGELEDLMAATLEDENTTVRAAACAWIRDNEARWTSSVEHFPDDGGGHRRRKKSFVSSPGFVAALIVVALLGLLFALYRGFRAGCRTWRRLRGADETLSRERLKRLQRAVDAVHACEHPMVVLSLADLRRRGRLPTHETVRGELTFLDTYEDVVAFSRKHAILFVSHQWLSVEEPDPDNSHFDATCAAAGLIAERDGLDPDDLFLWVDYFSVPQRNRTSQAAACNSLSVFANACRYFVAVCPEATHRASGDVVDAATYRTRGWCRLEMWAMMSKPDGAASMYFYDGSLKTIVGRRDWYDAALSVFSGQFSREEDKEKIVDNVLGLYARSLHRAMTRVPSGDSEHDEESVPRSVRSVRASEASTKEKGCPACGNDANTTSPTGTEQSLEAPTKPSPTTGRPLMERRPSVLFFTTRSFQTVSLEVFRDATLRETVFPREYFGDLIEALEDHLAKGELKWPWARAASDPLRCECKEEGDDAA